ncbi:MAG: T9SS type A sorting domain-containing protein [Flavobacteriales bacterium]|nr:T9SS type A sorting domain-containing protein [Flavobacteriales bacterium]
MNKPLLFILAAATTGTASAQMILLNENFDSYNSGDLVAQTAGAPWNTWTQTPGGADDAPVSDEQAASGTMSMKVTGAAAGGPVDLILGLGNRTTGLYSLSWSMYIPTGSGGYYNIQHNEIPGNGSWMADITFEPGGTVDYLVNNVSTAGTFPHDQWFTVIMVLNMDAQEGTVAIDGTIQYTWQTTVPGPSQIGGIDFFAYAGGAPNVPLYYVDDVLFMDLTGLGMGEAVQTALNTYPNPTEGMVTIEWAGASADALVDVLDVTGRTVVAPRKASPIGLLSRTTVNLGAYPEGVYFVRLRDGDRQEVRRVTKH